MPLAPKSIASLIGGETYITWEDCALLKHIEFDPIKHDRFLIVTNEVSLKKFTWAFYTGTNFNSNNITSIFCIMDGIENRNFVASYEINSNVIHVGNIFNCPIEEFGVLKDPNAVLILKGDNLIVKTKVIPICDHEWVNVGFSSIKMVCKKCDMEKA
jgi:hypothetical protein